MNRRFAIELLMARQILDYRGSREIVERGMAAQYAGRCVYVRPLGIPEK